MSQFSTTIVFGEQAAKRYAEGETSDDVLNEWGSVQTFSFTTEAEHTAFLSGVEATSGWLDYAIKEDETAHA